jgi:hypothetical protein
LKCNDQSKNKNDDSGGLRFRRRVTFGATQNVTSARDAVKSLELTDSLDSKNLTSLISPAIQLAESDKILKTLPSWQRLLYSSRCTCNAVTPFRCRETDKMAKHIKLVLAALIWQGISF